MRAIADYPRSRGAFSAPDASMRRYFTPEGFTPEGLYSEELGDFVSQSGHVADETQDKEDLARIAYFEAIRIVKNHHDAQDIAGEAMVRLEAALVPHENPGAWIRKVAHNLALDHVERDKRFQRVAPLLVDRDQSCLPEEALSVGTE